MMKVYSNYFLVGVVLAFAFSLSGCGSESGGTQEETGGGGTTITIVPQSFAEQCSFCHSAGKSQDVAVVHSTAIGSPQVSIIAVREIDLGGGDVRLEVDVRIVDSTNPLVPIYIDPNDTSNSGTGRLRLTLAKLVPDVAPTNWKSYLNSSAAPLRATYERANASGGVFTVLPTPGEYRYRFSFNMNAVTDPLSGAPILYEKARTHRIATQFSGNVDNAFVDFEPSAIPVGGQITAPFPAVADNRKISTNTSCNECHVRLGFHGGDRINVNYCVTCHNPDSTDPTSGNTVDFKVMIHKIHRGEDLPVVQAGGSYTLGRSADFSTVVYPQDIRNCTKCHTSADAATPQGDNWKNVPTTETCTSCHDAPVPPVPNFPNLTPQEITDAHVILAQVAAAKFKYNIISITNTAPGEFPVVTFSVTDPTNANAPYDINNDPEFNAGSASTLNILIGWDTKDYTNTGSLRTPAQPISISALAGAQDNLDGTFTVASTVPIPAGVTGSGVVAIEGHPAVETVPGSGTYNLRVPVTGEVKSFIITGNAVQNRRTVVNVANCNQCHGLLSLHGSNRNNNPQLCVICHNADVTDINVRPVPGPGVDGKAEEAIDFKYMIHSIHAGAAAEHGFRTNGIVVYGFRGSVNDFSHVRLPSGDLNMRNCTGCHTPPIGLPNANALPTTINTGSNKSSPNDDVNITPTASVCSSCHDDTASKTHMTANGGRFDYKAFVTVVSGGGGEGGGGGDQAAVCGPGPVSAQPVGHTSRTDCCSCHSPQ